VGPVTIDVLRAQAAQGSLKATDPVWPEGSRNATMAAQLDFLHAALAQAPRARSFTGAKLLLLVWIVAVMAIASLVVWALLRR
jgi:hypothetical protein